MVSKSGGAFLRPQTATRMGWNMGPALRPSEAAACAQCLIERVVIERRRGKHLPGLLKDAAGKRGIALLRDQFGRVIRGKLVDKEKIGGGDSIAKQLDALANQRGDGEEPFGRRMEAGPLEERLQFAAELLDGKGADVFSVQPYGLGIERIFLSEIDDGVGAVDALKRESGDELVEGEELAVVLGRPAEKAEEVDECLGQKSGVAIGGDADDGSVPALGEFGAIRGDEQGEMRELGRVNTEGSGPRASKISRCLKVLVR